MTVTITDIVTEQRTHDWIAYVDGYPEVWEAGQTEAQAIGELVISLR